MSDYADISDEDLTAYLDGEADDALSSRIEAALAMDASIAQRLEALSIDVGSLKGALDGLLPSAPRDLVPARAAANTNRPWGIGATVAASLIVGVTAGYLYASKPAPEPGWMAYVAAYQALYVNATLADAGGAQGTELAQLAGVLGRDLEGVDTAPNLTFKRGQVLGFKGKALVQLAYLSSAGDPVALCIIKTSGEAKPVTTTQLEGMQAASWSDGNHAYLLIGGDDAALVAENAAFFAQTL
ncbi:hypothetical protein [uncultured Litoreibacter sp.]|uniref:anti-sigma factor family protein n=1 Tax=uncultured Litoreibacter sp. TaxID=1392394 RepID=UPI002609992C|nr:hypothetical protein [uncultured Litoreibacter sp.]